MNKCSFCGKSSEEVSVLISEPQTWKTRFIFWRKLICICDLCIIVSVDNCANSFRKTGELWLLATFSRKIKNILNIDIN